MRIVSRRLPILALSLVWAACSDSPVDPSGPLAVPGTAADALVAPAATDAASLQAALDLAATTGGTVLVQGTIVLDDPLTFVGDMGLTLMGQQDARIVGPVNPIAQPSNSGARIGEETVGDALQILGDGDLTVRNLTFEGQTGHGIYLELTDDATGIVTIDLSHVTFTGQGLSGMWVEEQAGGSEAVPDPIESDASLHLAFRNVAVSGTGFAEDEAQSCRGNAEGDGCSWADFDGMRFNEGGPGDITFDFHSLNFTDNAGDGVEFDEIGNGGVHGSVSSSVFDRNGEQPQFPADVEDGFDIDEADEGGIHLEMRNVRVNDNVDEGVDLDEIGNGDAFFGGNGIVATGNVDENLKVTESDPEEGDPAQGGDVILALTNVTADGSLAGRGARFEEFGDGDVRGTITGSSFSGNTVDDGLRIDEDGMGSVDVELRQVDASGNDGQGLQITENGMGDILASIQGSSFTGNDNTAVEMEEEDEGGHEVTLQGSVLVGEPGEESLDVIEGDAGSSTVVIRGGTVSPAPATSGDVSVDIRP